MADARPLLRLVRAPACARRYAELLRADWTASTLDHALELIESLLATGGARITFGWEAPVNGRRATPRAYPIPVNANESVREFIERLNPGIDQVVQLRPTSRAAGALDCGRMERRLGADVRGPAAAPGHRVDRSEPRAAAAASAPNRVDDDGRLSVTD